MRHAFLTVAMLSLIACTIFNPGDQADDNNFRDSTSQVAWGWDFAERGDRILFKLNELDIIDESDLELNTFVETTRWANIKVRVEGQNILNLAEERNRTIFVDTRNPALTGIERREWRVRDKGFRLFLVLSGSF